MLSCFFKEYKTFLYNQLLQQEESCNKSRIQFANVVSSSVPAYLGGSPDMTNELEKEIYTYARSLISDIINQKTDYLVFMKQLTNEVDKEKIAVLKDSFVCTSSPLMSAILDENYQLCKHLIKSGADVNEILNQDKCITPLMLALGHTHAPLLFAHLLVNNGADINTQFSWYQYSLLHILAKKGDDKSMEYLIDMGAEVNVKDVYNNTPLHFAITNGCSLKTIQMLLDVGADPDIKNVYDNTARSLFTRFHLSDETKKEEKKAIVESMKKCGNYSILNTIEMFCAKLYKKNNEY